MIIFDIERVNKKVYRIYLLLTVIFRSTMTQQKCKHFNTPKGCKRGSNCKYYHDGDVVADYQQPDTDLSVKERRKLYSSDALTELHKLKLEERNFGMQILKEQSRIQDQQKIEEQKISEMLRFEEELKYREELEETRKKCNLLIEAEKVRLTWQCWMDQNWGRRLLTVHDILSGIMSDSLIMLIGKYMTTEDPDNINWKYLTCVDDKITLINSNDLDSCDYCSNNYYHDMWVIVNKRITTEDDYDQLQFRVICRNCMAFDMEYQKSLAYVRDREGNDPIWISRSFDPIVDWDDDPNISYDNETHRIYAKNIVAKLRMKYINEMSKVMSVTRLQRMIHLCESAKYILFQGHF